MEVLVYLELTFSFSVWLIYLALNNVYTFIRGLYWRTNGVHEQRLASKLPENYKTSAHVKRIIYKRYLDGLVMASEIDFVTVHEEFTNPETVLHDDWTIYTLTRSEAIFVKKQKDWPVPLFHSDFFFFAQFDSAVKIITMPLNQFNKLADEMENNDAQLVVLQNQARSGGTLLTSIFKETGRCVCFNEPHSFNAVVTYICCDNIWHGAEARRMFRSTVRLLCKPYRGLGEDVLAYVIKPVVVNILCVDMVQEVFPEATQLFMYREPVTVAISVRRIGQVLDSLKLMFYLPSIPNSCAFLFRLIGYPSNYMRGWSCADSVELEFGYRCACLAMYHYNLVLKQGIKIQGVCYADVVAHQEKFIHKLFEICQIPESLIEKAKEALKKDSQANSVISRVILQKAMPNPPKATPRFLEIARAMSEEFGVPGPDDFADKSFRLPNSLEL
jgi:hypothetical protein